jgi:hypothetical protein
MNIESVQPTIVLVLGQRMSSGRISRIFDTPVNLLFFS